MKTVNNNIFVVVIFFLFVCFTFNNYSQTENPKYSVSEAKNHIDEYATVSGTVSQVFISKKGTVFFNMGGFYPKHTFTAVIFKNDVKNFSDVYKYEGKEVEITGIIKMYQGKPEIILKSPNQIKILY